jgi:hypothetical protein
LQNLTTDDSLAELFSANSVTERLITSSGFWKMALAMRCSAFFKVEYAPRILIKVEGSAFRVKVWGWLDDKFFTKGRFYSNFGI